MSRDSSFFLEDIEIACQKIIRFSQHISFNEFVNDEKTYDAVIRNLEIIGEAAKQLPEIICREMPEIEWKKIKGLRDILIHHYFGIDQEIVWSVVHNKIPQLHKILQKYVRRS